MFLYDSVIGKYKVKDDEKKYFFADKRNMPLQTIV